MGAIKDTGKNIPMAATNTIKVVGNLGKAFKQSVAGDSVDGFVSDYKGNIRNQELSLQLKLDQDEAQVIANMANSPEEMALAEQALEQIANMAAAASGVKMGKNGGVDIVMFNDPEDATMGGHKHGKIYLNMAHQDGTKETLATVLGDELSHYVDYKKGRVRTEEQSNNGPGDISRQYGDNAGAQTKGYIGNEQVDAQAFQESLKNLDFSEVNQEVANTEGMEHRTFEHMFREAYYKDTGRSADADWEYVPNLPGDAVQAVPAPVYGVVGLGAGVGSMVLTGGATTPLVLTGLVATGLSWTKNYLDWKEGKVSGGDAAASSALSAGSNFPVIGPAMGVGSIIYDSVPRNENSSSE